MNPWLTLVLVSLATMRVVETIKEIIPWTLQPWTKSFGSLLVSIPLVLMAVPSSWSWQWVAILVIASSGGAAILHEIRTYLLVRGDESKIMVMSRAGPQRRLRM